MKRHLNTLFVTLEAAYLRKDGAAVEVRHEGETKLRVPLHNLEGIACFAWDASASAALMAACAEADVTLSFHNPNGKFLAGVNGFTSGNILLRRQQYRTADHEPASLEIARNMIVAKLANARNLALRAARDHGTKDAERSHELILCADFLEQRIRLARNAASLDSLRGVEGDSAAAWFRTFPHLLSNHDPEVRMKGRTRRPPKDEVNALLSFCYVLLMHDCRSALEAAGLDAQCGFLHRDRPGRPSLALDLMEEFRGFVAERTALSLLNRRQLVASDFDREESGAVHLREESRKTVLTAWQERKQSEIRHAFLDERTTVGMLPHLQARLLARHLRGDLDAYPAFLVK